MAYNLKNNFNYSIFFILDDKNNLIDTTIQKDSNLDDVNKSIEYYNLDGTLTDSFIYNIKDKSITAQLIKTDSISEARMSVSACTRRCVVAIYEESDYGLACSVISAFLPETFLAVVVGCRIGCR